MPRNDEYFNRYEDLCNEVGRAYCAVHVLDFFDRVKNVEFNSDDYRYKIIDYLNYLSKQDLCLTFWKIYIDNSSKANTVRHLKKYLRDIGIDKQIKLKLSPETRQIRESVDNMRKKYIAHLDVDRDVQSVNIELLTKAFFEIVEMIKGLYDPSIDDRVKEISEITISIQNMKTNIGLTAITKELRIEKSEETENAGH